MFIRMSTCSVLAAIVLSTITVIAAPSRALADHVEQKTSQFRGVKANRGSATAHHQEGRITLTLSNDFKVPDAPAPHWQVVDTDGNTYLLQRLLVKDDKLNKSIVVPAYVKDIAKVQIWCAWAEVLLGEASFDSPVTAAEPQRLSPAPAAKQSAPRSRPVRAPHR